MSHEWHGVRGTVHRGVFVTEDALPGQNLGTVSVSIGRQNANLSEVKERIAREAEGRDANAVANFTYGQKKHGPVQLMNPFRWDTESWFGEGTAMRAP